MARREAGQGMDTRGGKAVDLNRRKFIPLSYIDDVHSVRVGREDKWMRCWKRWPRGTD